MLIHTCGLKSSAQPCHSTAELQGSRDDLDHPHSVQMLRQHLLHSSLQLQTRINHTREILDCGCWIIWVCLTVPLLTCFIKVPLSPLPEYAVSPGRRAALLTGVIILREEVILVGWGKIQLSLNVASENLLNTCLR